MTTALPELVITAPELRGGNLALGACRDTEVLLDGPAGTGKTYAALYKIHVILTNYPHSKALVVRKHNSDLAGSAMATFQDNVLDPREGVYYFGGNKVKPAGYIYPNGSFLAVNGLDKPTKVKSFECDIAYINEASECSVEDIEFVRMRLRKGNNPFQQIIMDTNPDAPTHWLNQRCNDGVTTRLLSRHEDNPRYYDIRTQDWTAAGRDYIFGILGGLTGVRLARYRYGAWRAAEGTVFEDSWDRARNVIERATISARPHDLFGDCGIPRDWPRYLVIDFGFTHPFVCIWAARDPDGRLIIYRQIYRTKVLVEDHAKEIRRLSRWGQDGGDPLPREIICDHDAEGRATLERHLGLHTTRAHKAVLEGIQATAARFKPAADGRARLIILTGSLVERDQELARAKKPTCVEDEPDGYVWHSGSGFRAKEEPVKEDDHGVDVCRYLCARFDIKSTDITYSHRVY